MNGSPSCDWNRVWQYLEGLLPEDIRRLAAPGPGDATRLRPTIGPTAAQLLAVFIFAARPRRVLEIGTSTGYSALAMGRALQQAGGALTTVEIDPRLAEAARRNIADAGLSDVVEVVIGDANEVIADLREGFGLILQDGAKEDYVRMLPRLVELLEPHGVLVTDDVLFPVLELPETASPLQDALREYNQALKNRRDLHSSWLPIGDGLAISVKVGGASSKRASG